MYNAASVNPHIPSKNTTYRWLRALVNFNLLLLVCSWQELKCLQLSRSVPRLSGAEISLQHLSSLHEIIDTFALVLPDYCHRLLPSSAECQFSHLGMTIRVVILKVFFSLPEAKNLFKAATSREYLLYKKFSRRSWSFVHFMVPFNFRLGVFFLPPPPPPFFQAGFFYVSSCCVTPSPLPCKCWVPCRAISHNWDWIQRPLVQEVGWNPKKPWSSEFENSLWMGFSYCRFQVEFVFGLKEFIQVFTNIPALWTGWNVETSKS